MLRLFILWGILFTSLCLHATHNRAGEITYKHISDLTYEFTIITYTYSSAPADRPSLDIDWGDGTSSTVVRLADTVIPDYIQINVYKTTHTFSGQGDFTISMEDPNRNGGIVNIPYSINVPFYIESKIVINPFIGSNSSPTLLNPPIDNGCVGFPFYHNAGAYDPDGDSLSYELIYCKGAEGNLIQGYYYPNASDSFSIDAITGTISWVNPQQQGEYNVAFLIKEYRKGVLVGSVTRDMQITIEGCNNNPPVIEELTDTCVVVGDTLSFKVKAHDIDRDFVTLRGTGGPLIQANNPALFPQPVTGLGRVESPFLWTPICEHVQLNPYQMVFKAKDNGSPTNLVDIKTVFIKVISPGPENLVLNPKGSSIALDWNQSICENVKGYDIYRRNGYIGYIPDYCETGIPQWTGYEKIGNTIGHTETNFVDDNNGYGLIHGHEYCYMVVATFDDGAESYPSLEACASLIKDLPVITNVSIDTTDKNSGAATIIWSKPDTINTELAPGPYKYLIHHNTEGFDASMSLIDSLDDIDDTIYTHYNINSFNEQHFYRIEFINNTANDRFSIGTSQIASSIYLNAVGKARRVELSWNITVPWNNYSYIIYRKNDLDIFDSIGNTTSLNYTDSNLIDGNTYCYLIRSTGEYATDGFVNPLINWSQESCAIPVDKEAPCAPRLEVATDCINIENLLVWNNPNNSCSDDVVAYSLYYSTNNNDNYEEIHSSLNPEDTSYLHRGMNTIVGCYYVTALDSNHNESEASNFVCVDIDSCRLYELPNVFTPNGDNSNDLFTPFPYDLVEKVEMKIFNRWGQLVYETEDPDILWDGKDIYSKNDCSEGVYFYVCDVYEQRLEGLEIRTLHGTVSLYR